MGAHMDGVQYLIRPTREPSEGRTTIHVHVHLAQNRRLASFIELVTILTRKLYYRKDDRV